MEHYLANENFNFKKKNIMGNDCVDQNIAGSVRHTFQIKGK